MQFNTKVIYSSLFNKKWPDPIQFLEIVASSIEHPFWGAGGASREFAKEILSKDIRWQWLSYYLDDFAIQIDYIMRAKLNKWIFKAKLGSGALSKRLSNTEIAAKWLMDRYVAELKNLFDIRYKNHIDFIIFTKYKE